MTASNQPVFDVPGSTTIKYVGIWDAQTGGNFMGYAAVTNETFANQGTYTVTSAQIDLNA